MPLLAPFVAWTKAARAAVGTLGYAGPDGLGCTDLGARPDPKVVPQGTTIADCRVPKGGSGAERGVHKGRTKGAQRVGQGC